MFEKTITTAGTASGRIINTSFNTGSSSAIGHGSTGTLALSELNINSSNVSAISGVGAGIITLGSITFENSFAIGAGLTLSTVPIFTNGGLSIIEGTNAKSGIATLVAGTITVNTTAVSANSRIQLTHQNNSGVLGFVTVSARVAATSFTITSSNAGDTSAIAWLIVEPS